MEVCKKTLLEYLIETQNQSKNTLKTIIQMGCVSVDGEIVTKANFLIYPKQLIQIKPKPIKFRNYEIPILYEDKELLAIEKPAGLLSVATARETQLTAYHIVNDYIEQKTHKHVFILHRLDQETSGILLFAKTIEIKNKMQKNWNDIVKIRGYYALVEGTNLQQQGTIHTWLQETKTQMVYSNQGRIGKEAITHYHVLERRTNHTLLDVHIKTGRKNQIRVHMKEIGHPILGDAKYGNKKTFPRLALHAYHLEFLHPVTKKTISIQTEIPAWLHKRES